jgi:hypothetical protein
MATLGLHNPFTRKRSLKISADDTDNGDSCKENVPDRR